MICDCHLRLSSDVTDISSHITKLLKFIVLSQTNSSWRLECILGPILFSIYINDLPSIPQHSSPQCYVEDTKLILNFKLQDHVNAIVKLNGDFSRISNWTTRNQLLKNPNRTKFIIFGSRAMVNKAQNFLANLLGKEIKPVASAKDPGVVLDPILTYNTLVQQCPAAWHS